MGVRGERRRWRVRLPITRLAARDAREWLDGLGLPEPVKDDALLVLSELVTNSFRHSGGGPDEWIGVEVALTPERLRLEVADAGPGIPAVPRRPSASTAPGGRGLLIVQQLAERWGAGRGDGRALVWAELRVGAH
jgi:anti-sigma regulatory factor (Ser/Thr protein kinase)